MKLLSLNVEGVVHLPRVMPLIKNELPDVICLQEAGTPYRDELEALGYQVTFAPRCIRTHAEEEFTDGLLFASRLPAVVTSYNFYTPHTGVVLEEFNEETGRHNTPGQVLLGAVEHNGKTYHLGTTHFTWTRNGDVPCVAQQTDMQNFLALIVKFPAHCICGDFNIPRATNRLYAEVTAHYRDEVPTELVTSLDAEFHRLKDNAIKAPLLARYLVDYIFSQPGYTVSNVRQVFGVSDHAALVCEIV